MFEGGEQPSIRVATTTIDNSEQELSSGKAVFPTLLEHTLGVDRAELSGRLAGQGHQPSPVIVLVCS